MDDNMAKNLLLMEIHAFITEMRNRGETNALTSQDLDKMSIDDLRTVHRSLRDTLRSLGGSKS
jgi:hypothetical protein